MDNTNNSSFLLNDSDLHLSTSLCQWAGFELDCEEAQQIETSQDHLKTSPMTNNGNKNITDSSISPRSDGEKTVEMLEVVREFLLEKTSQFYNDIIDAQGEKTEKTGLTMDRLRKRYETLRNQTASVVGRFHTTGIEEELNNRLKSIDAALRQLSIMKSPATATLSLSSSDSGRSSTDELGFSNSSPLHQWRHWIESVEEKMTRIRNTIDWFDGDQLEQRLKAQQALQNQIENEGGHWVTIVQKYIDSWPSSHRQRIVSASIERRWHGLWIKSLEWQCRLERQIRSLLSGITDSNKEDADVGEPLAKRRRLTEEEKDGDTGEHQNLCLDDVCSATSDTIPFLENEYESLTPRSPPASHHEEEPISARDGGYSSGSSTVVARFELDQIDQEKLKQRDVIAKEHISSTGSSPSLERRARIENSPIKYFYKMTPTTPDEPPIYDSIGQQEKRTSMTSRLSEDSLFIYSQPPFAVPPPELTDSLLVNVGDTMSETLDNSNNTNNNVDDLEEILNLFRQGQRHDTFENELEELLFQRQGTVWVPLVHDDDEADDDERREQTPTAIVETPPNTPSIVPPRLHLPRISSSASLKRRRDENNRRSISNSFTMPANISGSTQINLENSRYSESADTNGNIDMSSSWHPATISPPMLENSDFDPPSLLNNSNSGRKKLRACRLRRSWSGSVQFGHDSNLSRRRITVDSMEQGRPELNSPTRPNTAISNVDDVHCGSSDQSEECGGVMTGGGETMAEEVVECERVVHGINGAVWEWDDYKPPNHNENGPIDESNLDDSMLTAFDDDYGNYLDQASSPRSSELILLDDTIDSSSVLSTRLPPLGISYDSESEETSQIIKESQQQLLSTRFAVKKLRLSADGRDYVDYLSTCEYNINRLETLVEPLDVQSKRKKEENNFIAAELLQDWRDLALLLTRYILESPPPSTMAGRNHRSSEDEERFVNALQNEMQRLAMSLTEIITQGAARTMAIGASNGSNAYKSLEETQEILELLKAVRRSLTADKIRLDCILQEYHTSVKLFSTQCEAIGQDVAHLRSYFEQAYQSCDCQLRELEALRQKWSCWQQTELLCHHMLSKIGSETSRLDYKTLQSELIKLEERVWRLEDAFAKLTPFSSASIATVDESILTEFKERTELMRRELDLLKAKINEKSDITSSDDETVVTDKKTNAIRRKRAYSLTTTDGENESLERVNANQPGERKRLASLRRLLFRSWPIQLCLCLLICLNIFIFYPSCCDMMNNYWWSFTPKTSYQNGPPPT